MVLASCLVAPLLAAPHRFRVHSNSTLTIQSIAQGPDGFLWLAATDGLYRFDGFRYDKIPDFPFSDARFVAFTPDGSLWVASSEGLVRRKDQFDVLLRDPVLHMVALPDEVIVKLTLRDNVRIRLDGSMEKYAMYARRDLTADADGRLWFVVAGAPMAVWSVEPDDPASLQKALPLPKGDFVQSVRDSAGRIWVANSTEAIGLQEGRQVFSFRRRPSLQASRASPLLMGRNGQLWFLGYTIHGTSPPVVFRERQAYDHLDLTAGFEDDRGRLWIAVQGRGLVEWIPDPNWERWFAEDLEDEPAQQVLLTENGERLVATRRNLHRLDPATREWVRTSKGDHEYISLISLPEGGFLAAVRGLGLARLSPAGDVLQRLENPLPNDDYRRIQRDGLGRLWVGHSRGVVRIENSERLYRPRKVDLPESDWLANVGLQLGADGRLWAAYEDGIAWLDDEDHWHNLAADRPLKGVFSLAPAGPRIEGDIWVSSLGENQWIGHTGGRVSRLQRSGNRWVVQDLGVAEGFGPPNTRFLARDTRGWIWRGTTDGVYVSDGRNVSPQDWLHLHFQNGLASESAHQFGFFEDHDGSVWISGEQGVTHLKPESSWFEAPGEGRAPRVTRLEADGQDFLQPEQTEADLSSAPGILRIDVGSLDAPSFRDYPFRYRLLPAFSDWLSSADGTLVFRNLPAGAYTLEVAYAGSGTSPTLSFTLRLAGPARRLSWLWLLALPGAGGVLVFLSRRSPLFQRAGYRLSKAKFVWRRWLRDRNRDRPRDEISLATDRTGTTIYSRYRVIQPVSRGGFSMVYEARDLQNGNARVAVKILTAVSGRDGWVRERFVQEVAALRSIECAAVVSILDSWISPGGEPILVMPFLDGPTLRAALQSGPFHPGRAAKIVRRLGSALALVHRRGIVHRDFKPENIILLNPATNREEPVLIDFGAAGLRGAEDELAATTLLAGSFHYLSPERLTGHYSPATDVYAFGVTTLEMVTGKRLADLTAMFSDDQFADELTRTLIPVVGSGASLLACRLARAYDPDPRRRPADVESWAKEVSASLDSPPAP